MKTIYTKIYNLLTKLFKIIAGTLPTYILLKSYANYIVNIGELADKQPFLFIQIVSEKISQVALLTSIISMLFVIILFTLEVKDRRKNDSILNTFLSINQTIRTRRYMKRKINKDSQNYDYDRLFNKATNRITVDIRSNECIVFVPNPDNVITEKDLKQEHKSLEEYIAKNNESFYFSGIHNEHEYGGFWIEGSKKR